MDKNFIVIGNRIPYKFFVTSGIGESAITQHAGSYHFALREAGIEMCNIMTYSSILPKEAIQIQKPSTLVHGSVMESIMAVCHGGQDDIITSGIVFADLIDKSSLKYGGIVCEYAANVSEEEVKVKLNNAIVELHYKNYNDYELQNVNYIIRSFVCNNKYGTAIVALCFTQYIIPILN
jgi:arginine decarboxylase